MGLLDQTQDECKCDMRTKLVGDGCYVCNPQLALDIAIDNLLDEEGLLYRSEEEDNDFEG